MMILPDIFDTDYLSGNAFAKDYQVLVTLNNQQTTFTMIDQRHTPRVHCTEELMLVVDSTNTTRYKVRKLRFKELHDADMSFVDTWRFMQVQQHKNLAQHKRVYVEDHDVYIVCEHLEDTLLDYVEQNQLDGISEEKLVYLMKQLFAAVSHLHKKGYIHAIGQLVASSIYINSKDDHLLLDASDSNQVFHADQIEQMQQELLQSPFVAPEYKQYMKDGKYDKCTNDESGDVFTAGLLSYMLLTMNDLSQIEDLMKKSNYYDIITEQVDRSFYRKELKDLVLRSLKPDADKRHAAAKSYLSLKKIRKDIQLEVEKQKLTPRSRFSTMLTKIPVISIQDLPSPLSIPSPGSPGRSPRRSPVSPQASPRSNAVSPRSPRGFSSSPITRTRSKSMEVLKGLLSKSQENVFGTIHRIPEQSGKISESLRETEAQVLQLAKAIIHGPLVKLGAMTGKPTTRYYYLTDYNYLYCCRSKDPFTVTSKINLNQNFSVDGNVAMDYCAFRLHLEDKKLLLKASSETNKKDWVDALIHGISKSPRALPKIVDTSQPMDDILLYSTDVFEQRLTRLKNLAVQIIPYKHLAIEKELSNGKTALVTLRSEHVRDAHLVMRVIAQRDIDDDFFDDFCRDLSDQINIRDNHLSAIYGVCYDRERLCVLSKYEPASDLRKYLNQQSTLAQRLDIIRQIGYGMQHLHLRDPPIAHGSLKAENVLIRNPQEKVHVVIADYGFKRIKARSPASTDLSEWYYKAPEKILSTNIYYEEHMSDTFSFSILMFEAITQQSAYPNVQYSMQIAKLIAKGDRPLFPEFYELTDKGVLTQEDEGLYINMQHLIMKCWNDHPLSRPTFTEILDTIHVLLDE